MNTQAGLARPQPTASILTDKANSEYRHQWQKSQYSWIISIDSRGWGTIPALIYVIWTTSIPIALYCNPVPIRWLVNTARGGGGW